jgi:hypothetical protein
MRMAWLFVLCGCAPGVTQRTAAAPPVERFNDTLDVDRLDPAARHVLAGFENALARGSRIYLIEDTSDDGSGQLRCTDTWRLEPAPAHSNGLAAATLVQAEPGRKVIYDLQWNRETGELVFLGPTIEEGEVVQAWGCAGISWVIVGQETVQVDGVTWYLERQACEAALRQPVAQAFTGSFGC